MHARDLAGIRTVLADNATMLMAVASDDSSAVLVAGYDHGLGISGLYVINAAAVTFFAVLSMNLIDRGFAAAEVSRDVDLSRRMSSLIVAEDFVSQNLGMVVDPTFRMWNQVKEDGSR